MGDVLFDEFLGAAVSGSLCIALYADTAMSTYDDRLFLAAGILLLLEAVVAAAMMMMASTSIPDMLKTIKAPLFRCHELFALAFVSAAAVGFEISNGALYAAALGSLNLFVLTNTFTAAEAAPEVTEGTMMLSRGLAFTSSILFMTEIYRGDSYVEILTMSAAGVHAVLAFLLFFDFLRGGFDNDDKRKAAYVVVIVLIAMSSVSKIFFAEPSQNSGITNTTRALYISAYVCLVFAVGAANYVKVGNPGNDRNGLLAEYYEN